MTKLEKEQAKLIKELQAQIKKLQPNKHKLDYISITKQRRSISSKIYRKKLNISNTARETGIGSFKQKYAPPLHKLTKNLTTSQKIKFQKLNVKILNKFFSDTLVKSQYSLMKARVLEKLDRYANDELSPGELNMNQEHLIMYKNKLEQKLRYSKDPHEKEFLQWTIKKYEDTIFRIDSILAGLL